MVEKESGHFGTAIPFSEGPVPYGSLPSQAVRLARVAMPTDPDRLGFLSAPWPGARGESISGDGTGAADRLGHIP